MQISHDAAGIHVGAAGDSAGVENNKIRRAGIANGRPAAVFERCFNGCAVGLRGTASEALNENPLRHKTIVAC